MHTLQPSNPTAVHELDALLWDQTPLERVPLYGEPLPELALNGHRYLAAADGFWLEVRRPWLYARVKFAENDRVRVPFGQLTPIIAMPKPIPGDILNSFVQRCRSNPSEEQAALVSYDASTGSFRIRDVAVISSGSAHVDFKWPRLHEGEDWVLDLHSHARLPAFFSDEDDKDDAHSVKFSGVIGNCDRPQVSSTFRLSVLGVQVALTALEVTSP